MTNVTIRALGAVAAFALLEACSGGSGATPSAKSPVSAPTTAPAQSKAKQTVSFNIKIPNKTATTKSRHLKTRAYIGDGTKSGTLTVTQIGSTAAPITQTFSCSATCTTSVALAPATYNFAVSLYNGANGTGDVLSSGSASKQIVAGVANVVNLAFTGSVAFAGVYLVETTGAGTLAVGTPESAIVVVEAEDADHNTIMGAFDQTITLTTSDGVDGLLSVPAYDNSAMPGVDSTPPPNTTAEGPAQSVTITDSNQQPMLQWTGNGTMDYALAVEATISGTTFDDTATLIVTGGASPPPYINAADPEATDPPEYGVSPSPAAAGSIAKPVTPGQSGSIAAPVHANGVATSAPSGTSLYSFVNGGSSLVVLGLTSLTDFSNYNDPGVPQLNFTISTNQSGMSTFAQSRGTSAQSRVTRTLDLNTKRVKPPVDRYPDIHPSEEKEWQPGAAIDSSSQPDARKRFGVTGTPAVGATSTWYVGSSTQAVTLRAIINDATTGNPRLYLWTANSTNTSAALVTAYVNAITNANAAITTAVGDFHYQQNAPGIAQNYPYCNTPGKVSSRGPQAVADPGYVNFVVYDLSVPGATQASGYFAPAEYYPQAYKTCSGGTTDATPTVFLANTNTTTSPLALEKIQAVTTHEFYHLVAYVQKRFINGSTTVSDDFAWIKEGSGVVAIDLTSPPALAGSAGPLGAPTAPVVDLQWGLNFAQFFLASPQSYSLTGFADNFSGGNGGYEVSSNNNYGLSYLFIKYCTDQFGLGFLRSLSQSTKIGPANITYAADANGGGSITYQQILANFTTALALSNTGITTDPRYNFKSFNLQTGFTNPQCSGCTVPLLQGVSYAADLTPGQSMVVQNMFQGGFAFFDMNGISPSGNTIKTTDAAGSPLNLVGSLGQM